MASDPPVIIPAVMAPFSVFAQQSTAVLGERVLDMANGSAIAFASVVVEDAASGKQLAGTLTGENGRFVQGLPPGTYKVRISFVGYYPADADLLVNTLNQYYDLGNVRLPRLEGFEEKLTVVAEAIRAEGIDTQVFRLGEGPAQSTGTVLDALNRRDAGAGRDKQQPSLGVVVKKVVPKVYGSMNNHAHAKAVANALELKQFMKEPITGDYNPELVKRYTELKGTVPVEAKQHLPAPAPVRRR